MNVTDLKEAKEQYEKLVSQNNTTHGAFVRLKKMAALYDSLRSEQKYVFSQAEVLQLEAILKENPETSSYQDQQLSQYYLNLLSYEYFYFRKPWQYFDFETLNRQLPRSRKNNNGPNPMSLVEFLCMIASSDRNFQFSRKTLASLSSVNKSVRIAMQLRQNIGLGAVPLFIDRICKSDWNLACGMLKLNPELILQSAFGDASKTTGWTVPIKRGRYFCSHLWSELENRDDVWFYRVQLSHQLNKAVEDTAAEKKISKQEFIRNIGSSENPYFFMNLTQQVDELRKLADCRVDNILFALEKYLINLSCLADVESWSHQYNLLDDIHNIISEFTKARNLNDSFKKAVRKICLEKAEFLNSKSSLINNNILSELLVCLAVCECLDYENPPKLIEPKLNSLIKVFYKFKQNQKNPIELYELDIDPADLIYPFQVAIYLNCYSLVASFNSAFPTLINSVHPSKQENLLKRQYDLLFQIFNTLDDEIFSTAYGAAMLGYGNLRLLSNSDNAFNLQFPNSTSKKSKSNTIDLIAHALIVGLSMQKSLEIKKYYLAILFKFNPEIDLKNEFIHQCWRLTKTRKRDSQLICDSIILYDFCQVLQSLHSPKITKFSFGRKIPGKITYSGDSPNFLYTYQDIYWDNISELNFFDGIRFLITMKSKEFLRDEIPEAFHQKVLKSFDGNNKQIGFNLVTKALNCPYFEDKIDRDDNKSLLSQCSSFFNSKGSNLLVTDMETIPLALEYHEKDIAKSVATLDGEQIKLLHLIAHHRNIDDVCSRMAWQLLINNLPEKTYLSMRMN